jgi:hypothetical protein
LEGPIDPELAKPTTWTLEYKIPFSLLERFGRLERPKPGVTWRGNFYKCADDTSHPHWLTWSPVTNAKPSFHLPKYSISATSCLNEVLRDRLPDADSGASARRGVFSSAEHRRSCHSYTNPLMLSGA